MTLFLEVGTVAVEGVVRRRSSALGGCGGVRKELELLLGVRREGAVRRGRKCQYGVP